MEIRQLIEGDDVLVDELSALFDGPARGGAVSQFLHLDTHHLFAAYEGGRPVGFVTGVEMTHPDKGTEIFLYELEVDEEFRRRGIGKALAERLRERAIERDCYGMWTITDETNPAALATYARSGGLSETEQVVFVWTF